MGPLAGMKNAAGCHSMSRSGAGTVPDSWHATCSPVPSESTFHATYLAHFLLARAVRQQLPCRLAWHCSCFRLTMGQSWGIRMFNLRPSEGRSDFFL